MPLKKYEVVVDVDYSMSLRYLLHFPELAEEAKTSFPTGKFRLDC